MGTEKDVARGNRDDWKPSNAFWQQSQIAVRTDPRLTGERIEPKTTWLSERQRKRKEKQSKTFQPIPAHLSSKEAIEAYVGAMRKPVPTDEANLKLKEEKTPKKKTDEPSTSETQTAQNPAPLFPFNPGVQVASSTLTPEMLSALPEKQSAVTEPSLKGKIAARPNAPVDTFRENLKTNALRQLQQNRIRLDQSQQRFSDPDSKNPNWENLRQQSTVVATLNARERTAKKKLLEIYRNATGDRVSSPFPLLTGTATSPAERRALVVEFYQQQLGPQWSALAPQMMLVIDQFYVVDALRAGMFSNEPALAVLTPAAIQAANTPEQRRELHQRMGSEFGDARTSIGNLEWALKDDKDSSVALKFDQTVGQTLAGIKDPQQRQQVVAWVQQQQKAERERERQGTISSAMLTVGALASGLFELEVPAMILGGAGFLSFGKQSIDGMNQAGVNLDAVKAGDAGGQRLTSMNPHQARMDYQMALVNVGLSLLDAKVAVSSIREVLASPGAVRALGKLKPNQVDQFAEATKLQQAGKTAEAEKKLQQLEGEVGEEKFKQVKEVWQKLESAGGMGRIVVPRTPGLPKSSTLAELRKIRGVPGPEGIILNQKSVSFSEMWKLSEDTGLEYVLTKENGKFILRSGAPSTVASPDNIRPIAHTHPLDPLGEFDQLPSKADINALNDLWSKNPNGPRPTSTVIWGPDPGNTTQFGATGIKRLPKKNPHKR
jgi:hypothetical protein